MTSNEQINNKFISKLFNKRHFREAEEEDKTPKAIILKEDFLR